MQRNQKPKKTRLEWQAKLMIPSAWSNRMIHSRTTNPTTNFPKTKAPHQDLPKNQKIPHRKLPKTSRSIETGWNPKSDTPPSYSSSFQFLFSWSWHGRRCWCSTTYDYGLGMGELIHFPRQSSHECIIKSNNTPNALFKVTPLSCDQIFTQGECQWSLVLPAG